MSNSIPYLHLPIEFESYQDDVDPISGLSTTNLVKQIFMEEDSQEQIEKTKEVYAKLARKHKDDRISTFVEKMSSVSGCIAACLMEGSVHGYQFQNVLIQMEDGTCFRQAWTDAISPVATAATERIREDFDLQKELLLLQDFRNTELSFHNIDRRSGIEGRGATLFTLVDGMGDLLGCSRLLVGGEYPDNALNRILMMLEDLDGKVRLI